MLLHAAHPIVLPNPWTSVGRSASLKGSIHIRCSKHVSPVKVTAMGVDPQVKDFLAQQNQTSVDYNKLTATEARSSATKLLK